MKLSDLDSDTVYCINCEYSTELYNKGHTGKCRDCGSEDILDIYDESLYTHKHYEGILTEQALRRQFYEDPDVYTFGTRDYCDSQFDDWLEAYEWELIED